MMNSDIHAVDKEYMEQLLASRPLGERGENTATGQIKLILYDWNVERNWVRNDFKEISVDDAGFFFINFTKREPRHCTLRHMFVLDERRQKGLGKRMVETMCEMMRLEQISFLRFFARKQSVGFYESLGFEWHGTSKSGMLLTYWNIDESKLAPLPKNQIRYVVPRNEWGVL